MVAALGLFGCATPLDPPLGPTQTQACENGDRACFQMGRQAFDLYRRAKTAKIERTLKGYRLPSVPVAFLHPERKEYAALLVHGLNDSAYYMADIAAILHEQGFNVVTILLPGHGTSSEDMIEVTAEQWRAEVQMGLAMAAHVGRRVTVGGFSVGAALAIDAMLSGAAIEGLFLFSPPIEFRSEFLQAFGGLTCLPVVKSITVETDIVENPVKYKYRSANGVCQTYRIVQNNAVQGGRSQRGAVHREDAAGRLGAKVKVPTFVALTYADARVLPDSIIEFAAAIEAPVTLATFALPNSSGQPEFQQGGKVAHVTDDPLPHSFLIRRSNPYNEQRNPYFEALRTVLVEHLQTHFPTSGHGRP